ncbi:hypothetical protein BDV23DRAFT_128763 [Aspergillus alliaceus]|uniref:Uncharacterized protein n=1 Tax=Petromyces alliaceus TaxID=209559 RepID=A0A5N7BZX7_PETAA|nr:hypothetical protein BDV23DRAFT_128763 [Aspergillus alliaceus]
MHGLSMVDNPPFFSETAGIMGPGGISPGQEIPCSMCESWSRLSHRGILGKDVSGVG